MRKKSILIVDTHNQVQDLYASLLSLYKITAYRCPLHTDPLAHARRLMVKGVIFALNPHERENLFWAEKLWENPLMPVLLITDADTPKTSLIQEKYDDVLLKPFSIRHFQKIIEEKFIKRWDYMEGGLSRMVESRGIEPLTSTMPS